jgi:hypothetical protein
MRRSSARLGFGSPVIGTDGGCGQVLGVHLQPTTWRITHLAVRGRHEHGLERLVPMQLVGSIDQEVTILCSTHQFDLLDFSDEGPMGGGGDSSSINGADQMSSLPLIDDKRVSIDPGNADGSGAFAPGAGYPNVPRGQLHVRSGARIDTLDGHLGALKSLVVDLPEATISYLIVDRGHLFGKSEVAVPVAMLLANGDAIQVNASKSVVEAMPPVSIGEGD